MSYFCRSISCTCQMVFWWLSGFVVILLFLASSSLAFQRPNGSYAPMPDYDIRAGYVGFADLHDPRVAEELPTIRRSQVAQRPTHATGLLQSEAGRKAEIQSLFHRDAVVVFNPNGTARQLFSETSSLTGAMPGDAATGARAFLTRFGSSLYRLNPSQVSALAVTKTLTSPAGAQHVGFQQTVNGIPILGANVQISLSSANEVLMVGGTVYPDLEVTGSRSLSAVDAVLKAATYVGPRQVLEKHLVPGRRSEWEQVSYVDNWTAAGVKNTRRVKGPVVTKSDRGTDERTWVSRGPFGKDIVTSLVIFPLTPAEGRLAWAVALFKAPSEVYQIVVDAADGTLLKRTNTVKFASLEGNAFEKNPEATPLENISYQGTAPATPASHTFVKPNASGLQGNNVIMSLGINEKAGTDRDFTYGWQDIWATSGVDGLRPFNLDTDQRFEFTRQTASDYRVQSRAGAALPPVGDVLPLGDDDSICGPSPTGFDFFGIFEPIVCVNSNGNVTFNVPAFDFLPDPTFEFLVAPDGRVMGLWTNLNPSAGGTVSVTLNPATKLCFRWDNVPQLGQGDANTFGICLHSNGTITLSYPNDIVDAADGAVGIHPPTRSCASQGSASWYAFTGSMTTTGKVGMARFFPDTGADTRVSANTVFYHMNSTGHDRQWFNGFDELAGNFQANNFDLGGAGCDPIIATINPPHFFNNAFFGTPPDGTCCPFTSFGKFTTPFPDRETAVDSDVIIHEHGHGITNRIVGGPYNPFALSGRQSGAMGEGWSDFFAFNFADSVVGEYSTGNPQTGIRRVRYTATNGRRYGQFGNISGPVNLLGDGFVFLGEVHDDGEIWASFLQSVRAKLMAAGRTKEEVEALVVEALHYTPANPTMLDARNAILVADLVLFDGAHRCALWQAAAQRGLGQHAAVHDPGLGLSPDFSFSVFSATDRPKVCGGNFDRGPAIHRANFESAAVGATTANGWTSMGPSSLWHVTQRRASNGLQSFYYGQELSGNYNAGRTWGNLRSPVLNLIGVNKPILEFDILADLENIVGFDTLWIRVVGPGVSGGSQLAIRPLSTQDRFFGAGPQFVHVTIDLSPIANTANHQIEMYFDTFDGSFNTREGVYIDNIQIRASTQQ